MIRYEILINSGFINKTVYVDGDDIDISDGILKIFNFSAEESSYESVVFLTELKNIIYIKGEVINEQKK